MTNTVRTRCLLFFAVYLFLSVVAVAYDYHDSSQSKTCPICFMGSSLSSAVGPASFVPPIPDRPLSLILVERTEPLRSAVLTSGVSYRGPPPRQGSTFARLQQF